MRKDYLAVDVFFCNQVFILRQEAVLKLVEAILIKRLASHQIQTDASEAAILRREKALQ